MFLCLLRPYHIFGSQIGVSDLHTVAHVHTVRPLHRMRVPYITIKIPDTRLLIIDSHSKIPPRTTILQTFLVPLTHSLCPMQQCVGGSDVSSVRLLHPLGFGGGFGNSSDATSYSCIKFLCKMAPPIFSPWWTFWLCARNVLSRLLDLLVIRVWRINVDWKTKGALGRHEQARKNKTVWQYFSAQCRFGTRKSITLFESTINRSFHIVSI
jgi:hypothetical protein